MINIRGLNNYCLPPWQSNPLLNLQHSAKAPPPAKSTTTTGSDSEFHTDATTSFSGSEDNLDIDGSFEQVKEQDTIVGQDMPMGVGKLGVQVRQPEVCDTRVGRVVRPVQFRRGLHSPITLGEEIT